MPRPVLLLGKVSVLLGLIARRNSDAAYNKKNQDTQLYFLLFSPIHPSPAKAASIPSSNSSKRAVSFKPGAVLLFERSHSRGKCE
ncbi:hypothetical protein AVEN_63763-1 [Araneus ventricosus]|uniref:Secreted protein n=1 Tax=Araneus ventricosus TaxID=182803 RepID=A0A4Y2GZ10_ARAVE|nr:hypothetical protein AVEN_63763-1 [Araneus ventricosus]